MNQTNFLSRASFPISREHNTETQLANPEKLNLDLMHSLSQIQELEAIKAALYQTGVTGMFVRSHMPLPVSNPNHRQLRRRDLSRCQYRSATKMAVQIDSQRRNPVRRRHR
jgi:hypothetical protein